MSTPLSSSVMSFSDSLTPRVPKSEPGVVVAVSSCESGAKPLAPKCLFVRPFEDDYSPVRPAAGGAAGSPTTPAAVLSRPLKLEDGPLTPPGKGKSDEADRKLEDQPPAAGKAEDQDSDYESMASDSSIKRDSLSDTSLNKSDSFCCWENGTGNSGREEAGIKEGEVARGGEEVTEMEDEEADCVPLDMDGFALCPTSGNFTQIFQITQHIYEKDYWVIKLLLEYRNIDGLKH